MNKIKTPPMLERKWYEKEVSFRVKVVQCNKEGDVRGWIKICSKIMDYDHHPDEKEEIFKYNLWSGAVFIGMEHVAWIAKPKTDDIIDIILNTFEGYVTIKVNGVLQDAICEH